MASKTTAAAVPNFSDARLKLDRATTHIEEVQGRINAFLASSFYKLLFVPDELNGTMTLDFESLHEPDNRINAIIGDAIGNMRSFLDYVAVALAGNTEVGFPFADDLNGFSGQIKSKKCLATCPATVHRFFVEDVQAYRDGRGHNLWILNKLRNIDKHRLLLASAQLAGVRLSYSAGGNYYQDCTFGRLAGSRGPLILMTLTDIKFHDQPQPVFEIEFLEPEAERRSVLAFLRTAHHECVSLLDALESFIIREAPFQ